MDIVKLANQLDTGEPEEVRALRAAREIDTEHDMAVHVREAMLRFCAKQ